MKILKGIQMLSKERWGVSLVDCSYHQIAGYINIEQAVNEFGYSTNQIKDYIKTGSYIKPGMRLMWTKNLTKMRKKWLKNRRILLKRARKNATYMHGNNEQLIKQYMNEFILNLR